MVDRGHLDRAGGQRGLGLEAIPFERRHRCEEMVLVPSVLLGQMRKVAVLKKKKIHKRYTDSFHSASNSGVGSYLA